MKKLFKKSTQVMTETQKVPTHATTETVKRFLINVFAVIFIFIGITASFFHRPFSDKNPEIKKIDHERALLKKSWNLIEHGHDSLLKYNLISKNEYFKVKQKNEALRIQSFRSIAQKRATAHTKFSYNGRSSFKYWLFIFGVFLTLFVSSCFAATKDYRLKQAGLLKWYEPYTSISYISVSLFWICHTFFRTSTDYGLTTYSLIVLITAIPVSYFIYHFLRKSFLIEEKLKDLILLAFRIRDKHYIDVAVKAKYAEQYDKAMVDTKTVKQNADELDKDIDNTFNQVL